MSTKGIVLKLTFFVNGTIQVPTLKPDKVRRLHNETAKFQGSSLKNAPLTVLDLLQNSIHVLIRFCQYQHDFSADIAGMFLQVGVILQDQPSIRFSWQEDPVEKTAVHQNVRYMFVTKDSPTCAQTEHNCQ